jgi:hypothetical protein
MYRLSLRMIISDLYATQKDLAKQLGAYTNGEQLEMDDVYLYAGNKVKFRMNDAALDHAHGNSIIHEKSLPSNTAYIRNNSISVLPVRSAEDFAIARTQYGEPSYNVRKCRSIYVTRQHPELRIYIDNNVTITKNDKSIKPDTAFLEFQVNYNLTDNLTEKGQYLLELAEAMDITVGQLTEKSYGDMILKPYY